jgi:hypothetical protein
MGEIDTIHASTVDDPNAPRRRAVEQRDAAPAAARPDASRRYATDMWNFDAG